MLLASERAAIVEACRFMQREHLVVGTAGNVSVRVGDRMAISPSGVAYESMTAADVVITDLAGVTVEGELQPSSELPLHLALYAATGAGAITHNHAPASTALGLVVDQIPASHYYSAMFGGVVVAVPLLAIWWGERHERQGEHLAEKAAMAHLGVAWLFGGWYLFRIFG